MNRNLQTIATNCIVTNISYYEQYPSAIVTSASGNLQPTNIETKTQFMTSHFLLQPCRRTQALLNSVSESQFRFFCKIDHVSVDGVRQMFAIRPAVTENVDLEGY